MIHSMTGYGVATRQAAFTDAHGAPSGNVATVSVEFRTVNSRFLDLLFRAPEECRAFEPALREMLMSALSRGKLECRINLQRQEAASDVAALERPKIHRGFYYVLMGLLSPLDGVTPEALGIDRLLKRIKAGGVREVIIATNPTIEGEATAVYLAKVIPPLGAKVSRIARGIPVGSGLGYVDEATLREALKGRREVTS